MRRDLGLGQREITRALEIGQTTDRPLTVTAADGAATRYQYTNREVLMRDPANKWMKRVSDGLGRLKEVVEDAAGTIDTFTNSSPLSFSTVYKYDVRDQLLGRNSRAGVCTAMCGTIRCAFGMRMDGLAV